MLDEYNQRYIANNKIIELTKMETAVLSILIQERGKIVEYNILPRSVRKIIKNLRCKLDKVLQIKTKRAKGYYI